jgi:hypothetical protein
LARNIGWQFPAMTLVFSSMVQGQEEMQDEEEGTSRKSLKNVLEEMKA